MGSNSGTYLKQVPEGVDLTQEEWDELSYDMQYYYANDDRQEYLKDKAAQVTERNKDFSDRVKSNNCCRYCSESIDCVLEWHHLEEKDSNVSDLVRSEYSIERIAEEMDKCVLLCANCHKKAHANMIAVSNLTTGAEEVTEKLK
jgi:predicted HNH restriction endonuclease